MNETNDEIIRGYDAGTAARILSDSMQGRTALEGITAALVVLPSLTAEERCAVTSLLELAVIDPDKTLAVLTR